jgi:hypothetical protein
VADVVPAPKLIEHHSTYTTFFKGLGIGATLIGGTLLGVLFTSSGKPPTDDLLAGIGLLVTGVAFLSAWKDSKLTIDLERKVMQYELIAKFGASKTEELPFTEVVAILVAGNINWADVSLELKRGDVLALKGLPRSAAGREELKTLVRSLEAAFGVEARMSDDVRGWWDLRPPTPPEAPAKAARNTNNNNNNGQRNGFRQKKA